MNRFLKDEDYFQIKPEILKLLDGATSALSESKKLLSAERAAIAQIKNRLSGRFDCDLIFKPPTETDLRDRFIVMIVIDIALYHLYSQTAGKDVPEHRQHRYDEALDWLREAGAGKISTNLPSIFSASQQGEIRIWSEKPENHSW